MKTLLFYLFLLLSATFVAFAQEEETNEETVTETATNETVEVILTAGPGVSTSFIFPNYPTKKIAIGHEIEVIVGFLNEGSLTYNVSEIFAAFRYPGDWRYYIQNFTRQPNTIVVKPGEQHSFVYSFTPDPFLEPRDLGFSGQFFYSDSEGNNYTSYWYNTTITLIELQEPLDVQTLFTYVGLIGVAGLVLFIIYKSVSEKKAKRPKRVETGTVKESVIDEDWLEGTNARLRPGKSQKSASPKGSRKVK
jgi:translocon-associated protein subunit alpha